MYARCWGSGGRDGSELFSDASLPSGAALFQIGAHLRVHAPTRPTPSAKIEHEAGIMNNKPTKSRGAQAPACKEELDPRQQFFIHRGVSLYSVPAMFYMIPSER